MNILLLLAIFFFQLSYQFITYDSGNFALFDKTFAGVQLCLNYTLKTQVISFSDTFSNIPQVILVSKKMDYFLENVDNRVEITNTTCYNFTLHLDCMRNGTTWGTQTLWYAIDDQRTKVFNYFNQLTIGNQTVQFDKNFNANKCFISIISLGYKGANNFTILLDNQTIWNISVGIVFEYGQINMTQIGYQVICTSEADIIDRGLFFVTSSGQISYQLLQTDKWFMAPIRQINWPFTDSLRFEKNFSQNATHLQMLLSSWGYPQFKHTVYQYWVSYKFTTTYTSLICQHIRKTQIVDLFYDQRFYFQIFIKELNNSFTNALTQNIFVQKTISQLNIVVYSKCVQGKKISGKFKKCVGNCPGGDSYIVSQNCYAPINQVIFTTRYNQTYSSHSELIVTLTETNCSITQVLYNNIQETQTLLLLQRLDISS